MTWSLLSSAPDQQNMTDVFQGAQKLYVKQEVAMLEVCCSCEAKNRYRISQPSITGGEGTVFLYAIERSSCLQRMACPMNRSLTLDIHQGKGKNGPVVMKLHKPFTCDCCGLCWCCRPHMDVVGKDGEKLGWVDDPCRFNCFVMEQNIKNYQGEKVFTTEGSTCQMGMCCPMCCSTEFKVERNGAGVAKIYKLKESCMDCCRMTNKFLIDFNKVQDPLEKRLIFAGGMLLDLQYFEQNKSGDGTMD